MQMQGAHRVCALRALVLKVVVKRSKHSCGFFGYVLIMSDQSPDIDIETDFESIMKT